MSVFDLNKDHKINVECFMNSNIYYINDFYKDPGAVVNFLKDHPPNIHAPEAPMGDASVNGIQFFDYRHTMHLDEVEPVYSYLSNICGQKRKYKHDLLMTNKTKFILNSFNDYKNNYWHPHKDFGYTALIYLNKNDNECGTNLYRSIVPDIHNQLGEHVTPWRSKSKWSIIKTLEPKYNQCVIFDGLKFNHGMSIPNEKYFGDEYRLNQVFFFGN
jgi:hypothetical protein|tara:strand:+ start:1436 stop:2080 length:645 start_codon:yes stop_codon:yes gene_type:complete